MSHFPKFYDAIDDIAEHLRTDFIGPVDDNEVLEMEEPLSRYSLGILWAQPKSKDSDAVLTDSAAEEMFEDDSEDSEEPKNVSVFKPSTMGVSFASFSGDELSISFTYAVYHHSEQMITDNGKEVKRHYYSREAKSFSQKVIVPDKVCNQIISDNGDQDITVYFHVRKIGSDNSELITISVLNRHKAGNEFLGSNTGALFQCVLSVKSSKGFMPVYRRNIHKSFEEEKNDMLYDSVNNYSYGHGCSSVHIESQGVVTEVRSEFIPQYRMLQMMPRLFDHSEYLYMEYWKKADRTVACYQLDSFIMQYEEWFTALKGNTELVEKYPDTAADSFNNTRTMQIELDDFFANVLDADLDSVTKQAFFKARKNILPDAFKELFLMTRDMVLNKNKIKRHKGYRILAIDGSELRLAKTKENKDIFLPRNHSSENKTNAEISLLYDVISHYVIDAQIGSIGVCEREYAKKNLAYFSSICDEKDIVIFDRGYPSRGMIAALTGMGCKYLMRLQDSCFKGIK